MMIGKACHNLFEPSLAGHVQWGRGRLFRYITGNSKRIDISSRLKEEACYRMIFKFEGSVKEGLLATVFKVLPDIGVVFNASLLISSAEYVDEYIVVNPQSLYMQLLKP